MKPMLSVKVVDGDTGIELDKVEKWVAPHQLEYQPIGEIIYRTYRWYFAYTIPDDYTLYLEEKMEKENGK